MNKISLDEDQINAVISFEYNESILNDLRSAFLQRKFNSSNRTWSIPINYMKQIKAFGLRNNFKFTDEFLEFTKKNREDLSPYLIKQVNDIIEIHFPYNEKLIEAVKQIPDRSFNKEKSLWSIPSRGIKYLKKIIEGFEKETGNKFTWKLNNSSVESEFDKQKRKIERIIDNYKFPKYRSKPQEPFKHQVQGVKEALKYQKYGIFDDPGLGKTYQGICCIDILQKFNNIKKTLIVCKNSLKYNWYNELIDLFPEWNTDIVIYDKPSKKDEKEFEGNITRDLKRIGKYNILIINYENIFKYREKIMDWFSEDIEKNILLLDESQKVKNPKAKVTRTILGFKKNEEKFAGFMRKCNFRFLLTGTPISDKPTDAWSQLKIVDGNVSSSYRSFLETFCFFGIWGVISGRYKNLNLLRDIISEVSIRRLKEECLDLPPKIFQNYYCSLSDKQKKYYERIKKELGLELFQNGERVKIEPLEMVSKIVRLNQMASNPALLDEEFDYNDSCKFQELEELLEDFIDDQGKKVIVWTNYRKNVNFLLEKFQKYNPCYILGGMKSQEIDKQVQTFQNNDDHKLFISSPAGSAGITLTRASVAIYIDHSFSLEFYRQSNDRCHRIGTEDKVLIIKLIAKNTIDEYINEKLLRKAEISDYLQGDKDEILVSKISDKDLRKLLDI